MTNSRYPLFIALALAMSMCTEDLLKVNSGMTTYKIINSGHNLSSNGVILYSTRKSDGNFEFYTYNGSRIARITIDADGKDQHENGFLDAHLELVDTSMVADPSNPVYSIQGYNTSSFLHLMNLGTPDSPRFLNHRPSPAPLFDVKIRFGPYRSQVAGRYHNLQPLKESIGSIDDPSFSVYTDPVIVPFEVWNATTGKQLNVFFHDEANDGQFNLVRSDSFFLGGSTEERYNRSQEYIYVSESEYPFDYLSYPTQKSIVYSFWPVLPEGGEWNLVNMPESFVQISFDHYAISLNFDNSNDAARNFLVRGDGDSKVIAISSSNNSRGLGVQGVSTFDEFFTPSMTKIITRKPKVQIVNAGLFALSDGGFLVGSRMFSDSFDSVRFAKFNSKLELEYFATKNTTDLVSNGEDFGPVFVETEDHHNIFISRDFKSLKVFEVKENLLDPLKELTNCDFYTDDYPVDLVKFGNQYILLFDDGLMELLDQNFNCVGQLEDFRQSSKNHKKFSRSRGFRMFSAGDKIFYNGIVWDNYQTQPEKSKLVIGYASNLAVTYKDFDFGVKILGHYSCLVPSGGAVTLVQIQPSQATTDLIFFKTDGSLNTVK